MFNKSWNWKKILIISWIIISILYISFDIFNKFVIGMYNNGYEIAINSMIEQAKNKECKSFVIYNQKDKVELINVDCLKKVSEQAPTQAK